MPVDIGSALQGTITKLYYDRGLLLIVVISALVYVLFSFLTLNMIGGLFSALTNPQQFASYFLSVFGSILVLMIVYLLVTVFFVASIMSKAYYGSKQSVAQAFKAGMSRYIATLAVLILIGLIVGVASLIVFLALVASPVLGLLLFVLFVIGLIYAAVMLSLSLPFAIVGNKGPIAAMQMSWGAVKGNWWMVFITLLLLYIIIIVILWIIEIPLYAVGVGSALSSFNAMAINSINSTYNVSGTYNGTYNSSEANAIANARLQKIFSSIIGTFGPVYYVAGFISAVLNSWFIIVLALLYAQLVDTKPKGAAQKKAQ